ncbi:hypothetical protein FN846DRAFT_911932 [Sphaerosporella brunnea]|uniref:Uncharacterized protein n=1 Tax=Sphaerosporella brunnea TaxID=1250544 RepID=A0A5J5EJQ5_9PEZI|nr:hypothetical protein FN846DRAFT_911932 [Sphaerosporella brunnea]
MRLSTLLFVLRISRCASATAFAETLHQVAVRALEGAYMAQDPDDKLFEEIFHSSSAEDRSYVASILRETTAIAMTHKNTDGKAIHYSDRRNEPIPKTSCENHGSSHRIRLAAQQQHYSGALSTYNSSNPFVSDTRMLDVRSANGIGSILNFPKAA